jgi:hypothetical protein
MKTIALCSIIGWAVLNGVAQVPVTNAPSSFSDRLAVVLGDHKEVAPETFSLDFPGGWPQDLIEFIEHATKKKPNIMISPSMREVKLPGFTLQNVTMDDLFQALNALAGDEIKGIWQPTGTREPIWILNPTPPPARAPGQGVYKNQTPPSGTSVRVFPVGKYLADYTVDDITTSIQTAWDLGDESSAQLKFHKDTNLLLAVGSGEKLQLVAQVLAALEEELVMKRDRRRISADSESKPKE